MFYLLMLGTVVVVLALALAHPVRQHIDNVRAANTETTQGLDCSNTSISDYQKGQCVLTDMSTPYFIFGMLGIAGAVVGAKLAFEG